MELSPGGDYLAARPLQLSLIEANNAITTRFGVAGLKAAMDLVGLAGGVPRLPLLPLSPAELSNLEPALGKRGWSSRDPGVEFKQHQSWPVLPQFSSKA